MFRLSQAQLNLLATCPRKFQHIYLDQLGSLPPDGPQDRQAWGQRFHTLMQQQELGLPIQTIGAEDEVYQAVQAFIAAAPDLFQSHPSGFRQSEHRRTVEFQGYLLTVIYDLLILNEQHAQILDWKTYARPQQTTWLAQHWQTRLYPFVLVETSHYLPEQVSMTYWFVRARKGPITSPQCLRFPYSQTLHEQIRQTLGQLLTSLTEWLQHYQTGENFPQVVENSSECASCAFAMRCQRHADPVSGTPLELLNIADIQEVTI